MRLFSPAKVNLLLNVLRKRKDGYHDLETIFERIDLGDKIVLKKTKKDIILKTASPGVPSDHRNLAYRAAQLLKETFRVKEGVEISLQKKIPVSAGLGGGSSNAATVLLGLNELWRLRLSEQRLVTLAAKLGSDVPFFVLDTSFAMGYGRGERLKKIPVQKRKIWHCLVKPAFGISTREAYESLQGARLTLPKADVRMLVHSIQKGDLRSLSKRLNNSLELALNKRVTRISKIKNSLSEQGALGTLLSGSGSCVFGIFSSRQSATAAAKNLRKKNKTWKVFVASTY